MKIYISFLYLCITNGLHVITPIMPTIYLSYNSWCPSPSVYISWYHIQNSQILNCIAECITSTSQITGVSQGLDFRQFTDLDTELIKWIELLSSLLKIIDKGCQIVEHFQSNYGMLYYNYLKQRCQNTILHSIKIPFPHTVWVSEKGKILLSIILIL